MSTKSSSNLLGAKIKIYSSIVFNAALKTFGLHVKYFLHFPGDNRIVFFDRVEKSIKTLKFTILDIQFLDKPVKRVLNYYFIIQAIQYITFRV